VLVSVLAFSLKVFVHIYFFMWVRWTLPRYRYDQLMDLGWKWLIPAALANIVVTAILYGLALPGRSGGIDRGGLFHFIESTPRGLVVSGPAGYGYLIGTAFLVAIPVLWWVLAKINRTTEDFNLTARRQLQIQRRAERLAAAGKVESA
jgi:hypothetical protein